MIKTRQDLLKFLKENDILVPVTLILFIDYSLHDTKEFISNILDRMELPDDLHDETRKNILIEAIRARYQTLLINIAVVLKLPEDDLDMEVNPEVTVVEEGTRLYQGLPDWIFLFIEGYVSFQECERTDKVAGMFSEETRDTITERVEAVVKHQRELVETLIKKLDNKQKLLKEVLNSTNGSTSIN